MAVYCGIRDACKQNHLACNLKFILILYVYNYHYHENHSAMPFAKTKLKNNEITKAVRKRRIQEIFSSVILWLHTYIYHLFKKKKTQ